MGATVAFDLRLRRVDNRVSGELVSIQDGRVLHVRSLLHLAQLLREEMGSVRPSEAIRVERLLAAGGASLPEVDEEPRRAATTS